METQVLEEQESQTPVAPRVEHIAFHRIGGGGPGGVAEEIALVFLQFPGVGDGSVDHGDGAAALPLHRFSEGMDALVAIVADMAAGGGQFVENAHGALDVAVARAFSDEVIVIAAAREVRHAERIERAVPLRDVGEGAVRVTRAEIVQAAARAAHLVEVEQDVRHPVFIHRHQILSLGILGGQPVAVGVHPVVVGPGRGARLVVFAGLVVEERVDTRIAVDPHREAAHSVGILGRNHQQDGLLEHLRDGRVFGGGVVIHQGEQALGAGNLIAVDGAAQVDDQRHFREVEGSRDGSIRDFQMLLADLLQPVLVGRGGDADLDEGTALIGPAEAFDAHAVGVGGQVVRIGEDVAPVGHPGVEFESEIVLRGQEILGGLRPQPGRRGQQPGGADQGQTEKKVFHINTIRRAGCYRRPTRLLT